ncbi:MAG: lysophospholipase [Pleurocapsa minor GSE-CHR-MK-17-07R]|jgi:carboxylesterase|nr:lysophospholipase [Pleurocapsa minor GSE-CHR-MK 17-07R]
MNTQVDPRVTELFTRAYASPDHDPFTWTHDEPFGSAVLVHGFPGTPADMRPLATVLHELGWNVHGVLLPGFGKQIASLASKHTEDWLNAVTDALLAQHLPGKPRLLVGHSMGGALSLAATARVQVDALMLLAPFWKINHALWTMLPVLSRLVPTVQPFRLAKMDMNDPETQKGLRQFMPEANLDDPELQTTMRDFSVPTSMIDQVRRAGQMGADAARAINLPTCIIQGSDDMLVPPANTLALAESMACQPAVELIRGKHELNDATLSSWPQVQALATRFIRRLMAS